MNNTNDKRSMAYRFSGSPVGEFEQVRELNSFLVSDEILLEIVKEVSKALVANGVYRLSKN